MVILGGYESNIVHNVGAILLGRVYSFDCEASMQYSSRLRNTMNDASNDDDSKSIDLEAAGDKMLVERILNYKNQESDAEV